MSEDLFNIPPKCPKCNRRSIWEAQHVVYVGDKRRTAVLENIWNLNLDGWAVEHREKAKTAMKFFQTPLGQRVWCFCDNCGYHQKKNFLWRLKNLFKRN